MKIKKIITLKLLLVSYMTISFGTPIILTLNSCSKQELKLIEWFGDGNIITFISNTPCYWYGWYQESSNSHVDLSITTTKTNGISCFLNFDNMLEISILFSLKNYSNHNDWNIAWTYNK